MNGKRMPLLNPKTGENSSSFQYFLDERAYWNALIIPRTAENAEKEEVPVLDQLTEPASPRLWQDYGTFAVICQEKRLRGAAACEGHAGFIAPLRGLSSISAALAKAQGKAHPP